MDEVVIVKKNKKKSKCMVSFFSIEFYPIPDVNIQITITHLINIPCVNR